MSPREVHRAVARATGESIATIKRLGFLLADPETPVNDADGEDLGPYVIDWDSLDAVRHAARAPTDSDARPARAEVEVCGAFS